MAEAEYKGEERRRNRALTTDDIETIKRLLIDHHSCVIFKSLEDKQMARDFVKIGKMGKIGAMIALVLFILGGTAVVFVGKLIGVFK